MPVSANVTANISSGNYTTAQSLVFSTTEASGVIHYTIDGSAPTSASAAYSAPIVLATGTNTYIKALTVTTGKTDSDVLVLYISINQSYLDKIRRAVRRNQGTDVDAELTDIIAECRLDLIKTGVVAAKANDETDKLILGAVRSFARWKFGLSNEDAEANKQDYLDQKDELRRCRDYMSYAITFIVKIGSTAIADAEVTFNGETQKTDSTGTAVFYYVATGVNQSYVVAKDGYGTQTVDLDVTASATVNVAMTAG
jgi:hypothetical protein